MTKKTPIINTDGETVLLKSEGQKNVMFNSNEFGKWDVASVIIQATREIASDVDSVEELESIEFLNCRHLRGKDKPSIHFSDYNLYNAALAVKRLKFGVQENTEEPMLFRFFAEILLDGLVFNVSVGDLFYTKGKYALEEIDLSGTKLQAGDLELLSRIAHSNLRMTTARLTNCGLTDEDFPALLKLVQETYICQLYLSGNDISPANLELLQALLHKNGKDHYNRVLIKIDDDFGLPVKYYEFEYWKGRRISTPLSGGVVDFGSIKSPIPSGTSPELTAFEHIMKCIDPEKITFKGTGLMGYDFGRLIDRDGLNKSGKLKELDVTGLWGEGKTEGRSGGYYLFNLRFVLGSRFPNLEVVIANDNNFGTTNPARRQDFSDLVSCESLKSFSLANCRLADIDMLPEGESAERALLSGKAGDKLRTLDLSNNPLTDKSADVILEWVKNLNGTQISPANLRSIYQVAESNALRLGEHPTLSMVPEPKEKLRQSAIPAIGPKSLRPEDIRKRVMEERGSIRLE